MVQTKHLLFLVFVSVVVGLYSYHNLSPLEESSLTQSRSISSEGEIVEVEIPTTDAEGTLLAQHEASQNLVDVASRQVAQAGQAVADTADPYTSFCKLPRDMVNPNLYDLYCKNRRCLRVNETCNNGNRCCSGLCVKNKCAPSHSDKLLPGQVCNNSSECYSNICYYAPNSNQVKICYGNNSTQYCSRLDQPCLENKHCCSNSCYKNSCAATSSDRGPLGSRCTDNNQCESNYCSIRTNTCE